MLIVSQANTTEYFYLCICSDHSSSSSSTETSSNTTPEATLFSLLAIASLFGATVDVSDGFASIPWVLTSGGLLLVYAARCAYATKSLQVSASILTWALFWLAYAFNVVMGM